MGKDKKVKKDEDEDDEDEEEDMETSSSATRKPMKGGETKYPGGEVDGDDDRVEEKIKGSPYQETEKIVKKEDMISLDIVKDLITEAVQSAVKPYQDTLEAISKRNDDLVAKEADELRADLTNEPFGYSDDYLKDKTIAKLKELQEDFKQTKAYKDFIEETVENDFGSVDKNIIGDTNYTTKNVLQDFITGSNDKHWGWKKNAADFFTDKGAV